MDWKQFISSIAESIAWPIAAVFLVLILRNQLARLMEKVRHVKYKDLEVDFEKVKEQAKAIAESEKKLKQIPPAAESPILTSLEEQILDTAERAPAAAILLAWSGIETAMASAVSELAISPDSPSYRSPLHNIEMLEKYGDVPKQYTKLLHHLRKLRNDVAHKFDSLIAISQNQALDYGHAAIEFIRFD